MVIRIKGMFLKKNDVAFLILTLSGCGCLEFFDSTQEAKGTKLTCHLKHDEGTLI